MISVFQSGRSAGRNHQLQAALQDALHAGVPTLEFQVDGAYRLELDGFGGVRRVPVARPASEP